MDLTYRACGIGDLGLNECVIRSALGAQSRAWWQLWTWVRRDDTGEPFYVAAPVNPNGPYLDIGPGGRHTWGLTRVADGVWQVSPSIDVLGDLRPDGTRGPSLWHQTPRIVGVSVSERWIAGVS